MSEFAEQLSDEYKAHELIKNIPDANTAAKMLIDAESYSGRSVALPTDSMTDDQRSAAREKIAKHFPEFKRPESLDDYGTSLEYDVNGETRKLEGDQLRPLKETAFKHGLTKDQFEGMAKDQAARLVAMESEQAQKIATGWREMMMKEGVGFATSMSRLKQFVVSQDMPTEWVDQITSQSMDPALANTLMRLADQFQEGGNFPASQTEGDRAISSKSQAQARLAEIRKTPNWHLKQDLVTEHMKLSAIMNDETLTGI